MCELIPHLRRDSPTSAQGLAGTCDAAWRTVNSRGVRRSNESARPTFAASICVRAHCRKLCDSLQPRARALQRAPDEREQDDAYNYWHALRDPTPSPAHGPLHAPSL